MISRNNLFIILILIISIVPTLDLFHPGLPITHDGQDHVARIANFYKNLEEGNIIPRWAPNLNWGYGHPILMFLYPLPSYAASFFHFLGFNFVDSLKIVFGLAFIISGLSMYLWVREMTNEKAAFLAAALYLFAPYRFVDLYVRGAIGEHVAFIFPPLILFFLLKLSKKKSIFNLIAGSLSFAGLTLSHNAISIMFIPIIMLYAIYLFWQTNFKKYFIINTLCLILLGFGLSAFFLFPAFLEGKYTLRDIVTKGAYSLNFVDFKNFFFGKWSYGGTGQFSIQVGILHWIFATLSLPVAFVLLRKKNRTWFLIFSLFLFFLSTLFLMTAPSQIIWEKFTILQKFQFPWRFLSLTVFLTSALTGLVFFTFPKKIQTICLVLLIFIILFLNKEYWKAKDYLYKQENFYTSIYDGTTDTGESAPIWSVRFMERRSKEHLSVIEGKAKIKEVKRTATVHAYEIEAFGTARLLENTLYFPGWNVLVDKKPVQVQFQDPANRGLITFYLPKGKHELEIRLQETKLRLLSDVLTGFSLLIILFLGLSGIINKYKLWQRYR